MGTVTSCSIRWKRDSEPKGSMLRRCPVKKLSRQMTSLPSSSSRSIRFEPMKPAPPVTNTVFFMKILKSMKPQGAREDMPPSPPLMGCSACDAVRRTLGDLAPQHCDTRTDERQPTDEDSHDASPACCGEFLICGHEVPPRQLVGYAQAIPTRSSLPSVTCRP